MKTKYLITILLSSILIWACTDKKETSSTSGTDSLAVTDTTDTTVINADTLTTNEPIINDVVKDTVLDNAARFIAGLPQLTENSFTALQADKYWKEYQTSMDANWDKMYKTRLSKMAAWEKSTFSTSIDDSLSLFYPFSGPDFLHAFYLFPHSKEFVMAALEPIREVVPLDTISEKNRDEFLDSLGNSLRDIFNKSYFITTHMQNDLKQVKGVLPPLYFFIERSGHELLEQKFFTLNEDGTEKEVKGSQIHWQKTRCKTDL
jgi:hypothetical protein